MEIDASDVHIQHEAYVSKLGKTSFYLMSRGHERRGCGQDDRERFVEPIVKELPMEYAVELNGSSSQMEGASGGPSRV